MAMKQQALLGAQTLKTKRGFGKSDLPEAHGGAGDRLQASTTHWWQAGAVCWLLGCLHDLSWWSSALAAWGSWPKTDVSTVPSCLFALSKLPSFSYMNCSCVTVFRKLCFYVACSIVKNRGYVLQLLLVHLFSRACVCSHKSHSIPVFCSFIF